jgi:hypothetical protein
MGHSVAEMNQTYIKDDWNIKLIYNTIL